MRAGDQGRAKTSTFSGHTIRLPALPRASEVSGNKVNLGPTGDARRHEQSVEKPSNLERDGAAVVAKRRLGGGAASQVPQSAINESKGLKRAFKVPRSK